MTAQAARDANERASVVVSERNEAAAQAREERYIAEPAKASSSRYGPTISSMSRNVTLPVAGVLVINAALEKALATAA